MSEEPLLAMSPLATVLRDAFDGYWELNPPEHQQGTAGYYDWYKGQNEYVAAAVSEAATAQSLSKIAKLKEHLLHLRHWFTEASISDDEVLYQIEMIDEILNEIGEGV